MSKNKKIKKTVWCTDVCSTPWCVYLKKDCVGTCVHMLLLLFDALVYVGTYVHMLLFNALVYVGYMCARAFVQRPSAFTLKKKKLY